MITITQIQGTDGLNASRITINNNFIKLQDGLNRLLDKVDITDTTITIGDSASTIECNEINVAGDIRLGGNLTVADNGTLTIGSTELSESDLQALLDLIRNQNNEETTTEP